MFAEYDPSACYTGGRPDTLSVISATIRSDFEIEMRGQLLTRLSGSWSSITGQEAHQILVYLNEIDPTSATEGGMILPGRGEEAIWAQQHSRELHGPQ